MSKKLFVFVFSLLTFNTLCLAQNDTVRLKTDYIDKRAIVTDRPPQALYFQLGGSGPILAGIYDRRFSNKVNGAGFSAGLGFWGESGVTIFSIPVSVNYLIGRESHFIELAAGATFITARFNFFSDSETGSGVFEHINVGYRYQPTKGGFFFRGGVSPLFFQGEYITSYYLGFGHNF